MVVALLTLGIGVLGLLGALIYMQGLSAMLLGPEHTRTVVEWETMRPTLLRAGAVVALVSGVFMVFAMTGRHPAAPTRAVT